jgi:23S rRNA (cytosine1962-C5)-methyltransferase
VTQAPYELLDFGHGRKLERFADRILDRPAPQVRECPPRAPDWWRQADARFSANRAGAAGDWIVKDGMPEAWTWTGPAFRMLLRLTEQGQVGLFPEQEPNWEWIARQLDHRTEPWQVLNLFAYTGGSTLAAAASGAAVTHVDAAPSAVAWARENARLSELESAPVRWLAEDVQKLARRELRRERKYHAIILDPPSFGRGPRGEVWKLSQHLPGLLETCGALAGDQLQFILLTCHTTGVGAQQLLELARQTIRPAGRLEWHCLELTLRARAGGSLSSGWAIRGARREPNG